MPASNAEHGRTAAPGPADVAATASAATLTALLRRSFRLYADRVALVCDEQRITYRELHQRSERLAGALLGAGIESGGRIAVLSPPRREFVECYAAAARLGVTVVALNTRLHPEEIAYCLELGQPQLVFSAAALTSALPDMVDPIVFGGGETAYERFLASGDDRPVEVPDPEPEQIHNVLFTSGTTGRPKGAMISQRAAATRALRLAQFYGLGPEDGFVGWLPMFHVGGDESLYATLMSGGKVATFERAEVEPMMAAIERERLSWTLLLPGVITDFLHHPRRGDYDLSTFRFAIGYANMMPGVVRSFCAQVAGFWDAFGQTETSYLLAHGWVPPGGEPSLRKTPAPLLDVRIVDEALHELEPGVPGECVVRGPSVMSGYLGDDDATAEVFAGGWLHTGDVLVRNEDGTLSYVDRKKYLIKTGGENVYPAEVEAAIASDPAVQEVCVVGVPDEYWGETIKAVVVLGEGQTSTTAAVVARCRERLAGYKRPRYVEFLPADAMPRSTTGKLLRHELAALPVTDEQRVD
jgi:acyl-CoA synthetase (AMP-forming)/AMP-acid ligase II